jgi:hypothetical protein
MIFRRIGRSLSFRLERLGRALVEAGLPAGWGGYRWVRSRPLEVIAAKESTLAWEVLEAPRRESHPLPFNVPTRDLLPRDAGWWGYSFHDVPERRSGRTSRLVLRDATVATAKDAKGQFWAAILDAGEEHVELREQALRALHQPVLRRGPRVCLERATWLCERSYHNYAHWFTAHLPKLLLLRARGLATDLILPTDAPPFVEESLRIHGFKPETWQRFEPGACLRVGELTVIESDRFRPSLLRRVRDEAPPPSSARPSRKVFISRAGASRRQLRGEVEGHEWLREEGFTIVRMEALSVSEQIRLMQETAVLVGPHGAGLTNMIFCPPGTRVVEIANLGFPNPNFYALAAAMGHAYGIIPAEACGDVPPLEQDLAVSWEAVKPVLAAHCSTEATA